VEIKKGIPVSSGYAIGPAFVLSAEEFAVERKAVAESEVQREIDRLHKAKADAIAKLRGQMEQMPRRIAAVAGGIIEAHVTILSEEPLHAEIEEDIHRNRHTAEFAVTRIVRIKIKQFADNPAPMAQRVCEDLRVVESALLRELTGAHRDEGQKLKHRSVVVAHTLTPAQTAMLDRANLMGLVTETGGKTSHTAIVAASLGIPACVGVEEIASDVRSGDVVILDGQTGTVIVNPDDGTLKRYQAMQRNLEFRERKDVKALRDQPAETTDKVRAAVYANIETPEDIPAALEYGAEGIGLYRTEFLYQKSAPAEKDHLEAYRKAAGLLGKRPLVIRTLDLGADKMPLDGIPHEDNPFLGTRAIRLCFERPDIFRPQLRAILRAASSGNISIMIPMVSSIDEIKRVRDVLEQVRAELARQGESAVARPRLGIMVEVPSAAITADLIAPHVDFFSIGTNDLIAYTIAVDRTNERVAPLYEPAHPAILRLLQFVIDAGVRHKKDVSVCGEMSSDPRYTLLLFGMGLRIFSVVPPATPKIKHILRLVSSSFAKDVATRAIALGEARKTLDYLVEETRKIAPDLMLDVK
jgi:phosphotransferase system enzyme I (PtsI)